MADRVQIKDATGATVPILSDEVNDGSLGTGQKQLVGIMDATVDSTNKLTVDSSGRAKVDASGVPVPVTDNGGLLSVDDGGGSLTVDGTVAVSGTTTVDTELTTADLDTGAGTDTRAVVGLVLAASGGGALVGTANPMPSLVGAADFTTDQIASADSGDVLVINRIKYTVKRAFATIASGTTDGSVVAAVTSKSIQVVNFWVMAQTAATDLTFNSKPGGAGTAIFPKIPANTRAGIAPGREPCGWMKTTAGEGLAATTSASGSSTSVVVVYIEV